jgi:hypothetical protein
MASLFHLRNIVNLVSNGETLDHIHQMYRSELSRTKTFRIQFSIRNRTRHNDLSSLHWEMIIVILYCTEAVEEPDEYLMNERLRQAVRVYSVNRREFDFDQVHDFWQSLAD